MVLRNGICAAGRSAVVKGIVSAAAGMMLGGRRAPQTALAGGGLRALRVGGCVNIGQASDVYTTNRTRSVQTSAPHFVQLMQKLRYNSNSRGARRSGTGQIIAPTAAAKAKPETEQRRNQRFTQLNVHTMKHSKPLKNHRRRVSQQTKTFFLFSHLIYYHISPPSFNTTV